MLKFLKASQTILGKNARNLKYTLPENPSSSRQIADSKLKAKRILRENGIRVSDTYGVIRSTKDLEAFDWSTLPSSFVLKPNKGFGGEGILIVYGENKRKNGNEERQWIKADGSRINIYALKAHITNILQGNFSLGNVPDKAFFEERLKNTPVFKPYIYKGVPDIRVIVYNDIPVMAELRLPTKESGGKANLHGGGIGVGIDIASGITTIAIQHDKIIEIHPETKVRLSGLKVPFWDEILEMSIKAQIATNLGYLGADVAIDKELGPVMLEINARPGLAIQIANNDGLTERLQRVKKLKVKTVKKGIRIAKELFGGEVEEEVETILGRKIIGLKERVIIKGKDNKEVELIAKIDTGASISSIDRDLAIDLGFKEAIEHFHSFNFKPESLDEAKALVEEFNSKASEHPDIESITVIKSSSGTTIRPTINVEFTLEGISQKALFTVIGRKSLVHPVLIGSRDLSHFIIDTTKKDLGNYAKS